MRIGREMRVICNYGGDGLVGGWCNFSISHDWFDLYSNKGWILVRTGRKRGFTILFLVCAPGTFNDLITFTLLE